MPGSTSAPKSMPPSARLTCANSATLERRSNTPNTNSLDQQTSERFDAISRCGLDPHRPYQSFLLKRKKFEIRHKPCTRRVPPPAKRKEKPQKRTAIRTTQVAGRGRSLCRRLEKIPPFSGRAANC